MCALHEFPISPTQAGSGIRVDLEGRGVLEDVYKGTAVVQGNEGRETDGHGHLVRGATAERNGWPSAPDREGTQRQ